MLCCIVPRFSNLRIVLRPNAVRRSAVRLWNAAQSAVIVSRRHCPCVVLLCSHATRGGGRCLGQTAAPGKGGARLGYGCARHCNPSFAGQPRPKPLASSDSSLNWHPEHSLRKVICTLTLRPDRGQGRWSRGAPARRLDAYVFRVFAWHGALFGNVRAPSSLQIDVPLQTDSGNYLKQFNCGVFFGIKCTQQAGGAS